MKLHVVFSLTTFFVLVGTVLSNSCSTVDGPVTCDACMFLLHQFHLPCQTTPRCCCFVQVKRVQI